MCAICGVPPAAHEDLWSSAANGAILFGPLILAKARLVARLPGQLVDLIADAIMNM